MEWLGKIREQWHDWKALREEIGQARQDCVFDPRKELRAEYAKFLGESIQKRTILYEAYGGRGMICNPYAIFRYLLSHKEYSRYTHVWVIEDFEDNQEIMKRYASFRNVIFVEYQSVEYRKYLATAKYLINNVSFPSYFTKREGQVFIDTWHGIPLKTLGFDIPGGNVSAGNTVRNFLAADYLISPNAFMTDIYKNAFRMDGLYQGTILEVGQLRNDNFFHTDRADIIDKLRANGVDIDKDKKTILYAPTWKGEQYSNPDTSLEGYFELIKRVEKNIDTDEYQVLVKPHQIVYKYIKDTQEMTEKFIPAIIDTNEILSIVDVLISDYSSIYFDFLVSGKPIMFYIPDLDDYQEYRGLYFGIEKLPGPIAKTYDELEHMISDIDMAMKPLKEKYQREQQWACSWDDGKACERLVNAVFDGEREKWAVKCDTTSKKKLLMYGGPLVTNGITHSFITLLNNIDYNKFDVTVITHGAKDIEVEERINHMPKNVRVLYKARTYNATCEELARYAMIMERGLDAGIRAPKEFYRRELRRCVGDSKFDYVVEFTGYSRLFSVMFALADGPKKIIWMHNDLKQELDKGDKGGLDAGKSLKVCFSTYPYMDRIVNCSESIMELNRDNLSTEETKDRFTYARNMVYFERVLQKEDDTSIMTIRNKNYSVSDLHTESGSAFWAEILENPDETKINFVTMGRLSPEKNHENLIQAFSRLYKENSNVRLYILGDGPLKAKLENTIREEGLSDVVHLLGVLKRPFSFLRRCSCFILPSHYEGQPLVILEARALHMPIIVSDFYSVKDVLMEEGQLLVKQDVIGLYEGMKGFLEGKVPDYTFDYEAYNHEVYQEFEKLFVM